MPHEHLKSTYGLTPSEMRLALRLLDGDSLREAALKLGIRYETARSKLKFIFQKTGARRQAELILRLTRDSSHRQSGNGRAPHRNVPRSR